MTILFILISFCFFVVTPTSKPDSISADLLDVTNNLKYVIDLTQVKYKRIIVTAQTKIKKIVIEAAASGSTTTLSADVAKIWNSSTDDIKNNLIPSAISLDTSLKEAILNDNTKNQTEINNSVNNTITVLNTNYRSSFLANEQAAIDIIEKALVQIISLINGSPNGANLIIKVSKLIGDAGAEVRKSVKAKNLEFSNNNESIIDELYSEIESYIVQA